MSYKHWQMVLTLVACVVLFILIYLFSGCEQYRGIVSPGNIDRYISAGHFVCLEDGVATVCIKAVPVPGAQGEQGEPGRDGQDGRDGISIVGPVVHRGRESGIGKESPVETELTVRMEGTVRTARLLWSSRHICGLRQWMNLL